MSEQIMIAVISLLGTASGTFGGIVMSNKLTNHRLEQLEKKVEKHNNIVERTYIIEGQIREAQHDIQDLKKTNKN